MAVKKILQGIVHKGSLDNGARRASPLRMGHKPLKQQRQYLIVGEDSQDHYIEKYDIGFPAGSLGFHTG